MIQVAAVVPFKKQGRSETIKGLRQITGYFFPAGNFSCHGHELIAGSKILHLVEIHLGPGCVMLFVFAWVHGPGNVWHVPMDAPQILAIRRILIMPRHGDYSFKLPPGHGRAVARI
jgi:hypothetical protein